MENLARHRGFRRQLLIESQQCVDATTMIRVALEILARVGVIRSKCYYYSSWARQGMLPHRLKHAYGLRMGQSGSLFFFSSYHFLSHLLVDDTTINGHLIKRLSLEQYLFSNNITPLAVNLSGPHWLQDVVKWGGRGRGGGRGAARAPGAAGGGGASD